MHFVRMPMDHVRCFFSPHLMTSVSKTSALNYHLCTFHKSIPTYFFPQIRIIQRLQDGQIQVLSIFFFFFIITPGYLDDQLLSHQWVSSATAASSLVVSVSISVKRKGIKVIISPCFFICRLVCQHCCSFCTTTLCLIN